MDKVLGVLKAYTENSLTWNVRNENGTVIDEYIIVSYIKSLV